MTNLKVSSASAAVPSPVITMNYADLLRRAHQQKIMAREMVIKARQMVDSAVQMRNRPCVVLLP